MRTALREARSSPSGTDRADARRRSFKPRNRRSPYDESDSASRCDQSRAAATRVPLQAAGESREVELAFTHREKRTPLSPSAADVALRFGLADPESKTVILPHAKVSLGPGRLILLTGPSGSGKSSALSQIERQFPDACIVQRITLSPESAILDGLASWLPCGQVAALLTACGLGEPRLWIHPFDALSDGEKFRARLARAVALRERTSRAAPILCDEFCSLLHRRVARAVSYSLRKLVTRRKLSVVVACSQLDLIDDLQPDAVVRLSRGSHCEIEERVVRPEAPPAFRRRLRVERGSKRDYDAFAAMHYRATDELGFVDKVFILRDPTDSAVLGIVVYSHGPLELSLRNQATGGRFSRNPARVNRDLRILRRLVLHPDIRGCGLGHYLVEKTLPRVGTNFVECLAAMGEFNPVFEKAGMKRVGQYDVAPERKAVLESLRSMGVDPFARDFILHVCRRRRVRELVAGAVYDWYAATTAGGEKRVAHQSPDFLARTFRGLIGARPVYYLWKKPLRRAA